MNEVRRELAKILADGRPRTTREMTDALLDKYRLSCNQVAGHARVMAGMGLLVRDQKHWRDGIVWRKNFS